MSLRDAIMPQVNAGVDVLGLGAPPPPPTGAPDGALNLQREESGGYDDEDLFTVEVEDAGTGDVSEMVRAHARALTAHTPKPLSLFLSPWLVYATGGGRGPDLDGPSRGRGRRAA